jgi:hypothetical protein
MGSQYRFGKIVELIDFIESLGEDNCREARCLPSGSYEKTSKEGRGMGQIFAASFLRESLGIPNPHERRENTV